MQFPHVGSGFIQGKGITSEKQAKNLPLNPLQHGRIYPCDMILLGFLFQSLSYLRHYNADPTNSEIKCLGLVLQLCLKHGFYPW